MFENGIEPEDSVIPTVFKFTLLQSLFVVNSMHGSVIQWETNSLSRRTTPCSILWKCWICRHWSPWSANWFWRMATRSHGFFWFFFDVIRPRDWESRICRQESVLWRMAWVNRGPWGYNSWLWTTKNIDRESRRRIMEWKAPYVCSSVQNRTCEGTNN